MTPYYFKYSLIFAYLLIPHVRDESLQGGKVVRGEQLGEVLRRREVNPAATGRLRPGGAAAIAGPAPQYPLGLFVGHFLPTRFHFFTTHGYNYTELLLGPYHFLSSLLGVSSPGGFCFSSVVPRISLSISDRSIFCAFIAF